MNKKYTVWKILAFFLLVLWFYSIYLFVQQKEKYEYRHIGKTVVIKSDTLMVMGFNIDTQLYVLDDGREVSDRIVELFEIKDAD